MTGNVSFAPCVEVALRGEVVVASQWSRLSPDNGKTNLVAAKRTEMVKSNSRRFGGNTTRAIDKWRLT